MTALTERFAPQEPKGLPRRLPPEPGDPPTRAARTAVAHRRSTSTVRAQRRTTGPALLRRHRASTSPLVATGGSSCRGGSSAGRRRQFNRWSRTPPTRPAPNTGPPPAPTRGGPHLSRALTHVSPTPSTRRDHEAPTCANGPALDHAEARRRFRQLVPCSTAPPMPPHTKIRTGCGPTRLHSARLHPSPRVRSGRSGVTPADEEPLLRPLQGDHALHMMRRAHHVQQKHVEGNSRSEAFLFSP